MSTIKYAIIAERLTEARLSSYLAAMGGDLPKAVELYDWNAQLSGALHEHVGRLEVVFRNSLDQALVAYATEQRWPRTWYQSDQLFAGRHGTRALTDIKTARARATRGGRPEVHGKVIAELNLGFWRFLCTPPYLTSLWVPTLAGAFPRHPDAGDPRSVRAAVEDRIQRIHFLRNRIAHHEPIHRRNIERDLNDIAELAGWVCTDTHRWIVGSSRVADVLRRRPRARAQRPPQGLEEASP